MKKKRIFVNKKVWAIQFNGTSAYEMENGEQVTVQSSKTMWSEVDVFERGRHENVVEKEEALILRKGERGGRRSQSVTDKEEALIEKQ